MTDERFKKLKEVLLTSKVGVPTRSWQDPSFHQLGNQAEADKSDLEHISEGIDYVTDLDSRFGDLQVALGADREKVDQHRKELEQLNTLGGSWGDYVEPFSAAGAVAKAGKASKILRSPEAQGLLRAKEAMQAVNPTKQAELVNKINQVHTAPAVELGNLKPWVKGFYKY